MSPLVRRLSFTRSDRASARESTRASACDSGRAETDTSHRREPNDSSGAAAGSEGLAVGAPSPMPGGGATLRLESDGAGGWRMLQPPSQEARSTSSPATRGGSVAASSARRMLNSRTRRQLHAATGEEALDMAGQALLTAMDALCPRGVCACRPPSLRAGSSVYTRQLPTVNPAP